MKKILAFILARFPVVQKLKTKKQWISAALVVLAALIAMVEGLLPLFPETAWLVGAHDGLLEVLKYAKDSLVYLGL